MFTKTFIENMNETQRGIVDAFNDIRENAIGMVNMLVLEWGGESIEFKKTFCCFTRISDNNEWEEEKLESVIVKSIYTTTNGMPIVEVKSRIGDRVTETAYELRDFETDKIFYIYEFIMAENRALSAERV